MDLVTTPSPTDDLRCGYCREGSGEALARCGRCGARFHEACRSELGASDCPTLGCAPAPARLAPSKPTPAWRRVARWLRAPAVGLLLGAALLWAVAPTEETDLPASVRAHAHCVLAREMAELETLRLGLAGPIDLPRETMQALVDEYSLALAIDPTHLEALHDRAYWRWLSGQGQAALADYERLLELQPTNSLAWYQRGRLRCERGEHAAAITDFTRAIETDPRAKLGSAYDRRATCRREVGDLAGALEDLLVGGSNRLAIADVCQALGRHDEAVRAYDAYLTPDSRSYEVIYRRGLSRFALGQVEAALEDFRQACADHGHSPSPRDAARAYVAAHPGDPLSRALAEALRPQVERE